MMMGGPEEHSEREREEGGTLLKECEAKERKLTIIFFKEGRTSFYDILVVCFVFVLFLLSRNTLST